MKLSLRYGLVGIGALSVLSLGHWVRAHTGGGPDAYLYVLGVLPNVAAAVAIVFVLLSIWADQTPSATYSAARRWFAGTALVTGAGLVAWEFVQQTSRRLVFDPHDLGATAVGLGLAAVLFALVTPTPSER